MTKSGENKQRLRKLKTVAITVYFFATQSLFHYTDALKCSYHKIKLKNKIKPRLQCERESQRKRRKVCALNCITNKMLTIQYKPLPLNQGLRYQFDNHTLNITHTHTHTQRNNKTIKANVSKQTTTKCKKCYETKSTFLLINVSELLV